MAGTRKKRGEPQEEHTPPTIRTVAQRAGVAISTVSRVLNGGAASAANREKVTRAVDELGYVPSRAAQGLVTRRTDCVGLVVHASRGYWFYQIIEGIEEALAPFRRSVNLASLSPSGRYDASVVSAWIRERRVDGLVFVRASQREEKLIQAARRSGLPVALVAPDIDVAAEVVVRCDNVQAGRLVGQHLLGLGHRHIGFAGGPQTSRDTLDRLAGLRLEAEAVGEQVAEADIWFGRSYYAESGAEYARRFLASDGPRPTALVLANDAMAMGFMRILAERGIKIPEQLSIVGFDGAPEGALLWPGLTTVLQPTRKMAASACEALLARINGSVSGRSENLEYAVELVCRESAAKLETLPPLPKT